LNSTLIQQQDLKMKYQAKTVIALLLAVLLPTIAAAQESQKAVLITGASTGIGRNMAETLAAEGHFVYAGARKQADLDQLNTIENIQAIRLDVTVQEEIDAAVKTIRKEGRGLYGLVNNAGVSVSGPLIEVEEDDMQFQMDVNLFGPYRVTKAFAPLIIESHGRIITIGSISGILSGVLSGPYSMSKHAVEAYTDSLAAEMRKFDVQVSVIEPGNYNSAIVATKLQRMKQRGQTPDGSLFEEDMKRLLERPADRSIYKEPDEVSAAVMHAIFDANPKRRYMVVPNQREAEITIRQTIRELVQLNEGQEYTYDREALIGMLDEALAASEY
jgi:NAD(P)-dependent dehydrogenase (short-subunit alcohol dehydrogenase family)